MVAEVEERDNRDTLKAEYQAVAAHLGFTVNLRFVTFGAFLAANWFFIAAYGRGEAIGIFPRYLLAVVAVLANLGFLFLELRTTRSHHECMVRGREIEHALSLYDGIYSRLSPHDDIAVGFLRRITDRAWTMPHAMVLTFLYALGPLLWFGLLVLALGGYGNVNPVPNPSPPQNGAASKQELETRLTKTEQELQGLGWQLMAIDKRIDSQTPRSPESTWLPPFTALAIIGGVGGLLLLGFSSSWWTRGLGAIVGTASILGGGTFTAFKVSDPKLNLDFHVPGINLTISRSGSTPTFRQLGHVGPFLTGSREKLENLAASAIADPSCQCGRVEEIKDELQTRPGKKQPAFLLFIGSADKFELGGQLRNTYGSNEGLARARAEWLRDQLVNSKTLTVKQARETLMLTVGPSIHGERLSAKETRTDRSVTVFGIWLEDRSAATVGTDTGGVKDERDGSGVTGSTY